MSAAPMDPHEAIRQRTAVYNRSFDDRDVDAWVDCFVPDGRFEFVNTGTVHAGHDALRALTVGSTNTGFHTTSDFFIIVDGSRATQSCRLIELGRDPVEGGGSVPVVRAFGSYEDELVEEAGVWRFRSRRLHYR